MSVEPGRRYFEDIAFRRKAALYVSCGINSLYALFKMAAALIYKSIWWGAVAMYYLILSQIYFWLIKCMKQSKSIENEIYEERIYRLCGCSIFLLSAALSVVTICMVDYGMAQSYPGVMIFAAAAYTFYSAAVAVMNVLRLGWGRQLYERGGGRSLGGHGSACYSDSYDSKIQQQNQKIAYFRQRGREL